jgi:hypothetical protein
MGGNKMTLKIRASAHVYRGHAARDRSTKIDVHDSQNFSEAFKFEKWIRKRRVRKGSDQIGQTVKKSQVIDGISWASTRRITDAWRIDKEGKVETGICISQWLEHENLAITKLGRCCAFPVHQIFVDISFCRRGNLE